MQFAMQWFVTYQFRIELFRIHIVSSISLYVSSVAKEHRKRKEGFF